MTRLDRIDYVEGSRLLARDLGDTARNEARWQGLHVRGLHDTWGVATGLGLALTPSRRSVVVQAGAAFDCQGQVFSLAESLELPEPADLVSGIAVPTFDVVMGRNGPRWEPTGGGPGQPGFGQRVRIGMDIPLGRCMRLPWGELTAPSSDLRKTVHPMTRPRVGFGVTPAGGLTWTPANWSIRAIVDTSAANFSSTPRYVAWIATQPDMSGFIGPFISLSSFYPTQFTVRLVAISTLGDSVIGVQLGLLGRVATMRIAWAGVESNAGCSSNPPGGFV
ncbi:MAG TPA: hypothetical protein VJU15_08870 [Gemmatimonadales bacterium]|nr:hypothetical protein [Gemmatimonadales bacterium]